ncbi:uncharacterized protein LOC134677655 [Cydia fagiglandana]|uniref:uncharacterized protein LOC134677655 n=1 Tax=Cydia fagiglandana TaxID=1458189 RepID=UPI002FEE18BF
MLCLAIFIPIIQSTLTYTTVTLPHITHYWKTTEEFDKVDDYWNHGPVYIPGFQYVFTPSSKASDIFPSWMRSTTRSTEDIKHVITESVTPFNTTTSTTITNTTTTATTATTILVESLESPKTESEPTDKTATIDETLLTVKMDKTTASESIASTITTEHISTTQLSESDEDETKVPFSVFLRKLFRRLSLKSLSELPALVEPFVTYVKALADDQLKYLGDVIIPFVKKAARNIIRMTSTPDVLHARVYQIYNALSIRDLALDTDLLDLLNTLDDTFDETEKGFMQSTLHDVKLFPKSSKTGREIALDLLDNVILAAIRRINGTSKGETLYLMVIDIIENRKARYGRRSLKKISGHQRDYYEKANSDTYYRRHRKKIPVNNRCENKTRTEANTIRSQAIYQTVRNNLEDKHKFRDKVVRSASETKEDELGDLFRENQDNIDETVLSPLRHSQRRMKHQKHLRNHRYRHKHTTKRHRYKHGHIHKYPQGKRKYESLKHKYERLKDILAAQEVNFEYNL